MVASVTPLPSDCGKLCGARCCTGDGLGMELLPGETEACGMSGFGSVENGIFVCRGSCDRKQRPYACMIFPMVPLVFEENGRLRIEAANDLRAVPVCPIAKAKLLPSFAAAVRRSAAVLCESAALREYLSEQTEEYLEIKQLSNLLN